MSTHGSLADTFGRVHTSLRISVTDRCNLRCFYCMPEENVQFVPREELLTFEEIAQFVRVMAKLGVHKLRITGGEPLVRRDLPRLVALLAAISGIADIGLTTNGILLTDQVQDLHDAGLDRLNISLDCLKEDKFQEISRRKGLDRVLEGIRRANQLGFKKIRLNTVVIRGINEEEIIPLVHFSAEHDLELRFIEFMPLDAENQWQNDQVFSGEEIRSLLEDKFGPLKPIQVVDPSQPSTDYQFVDTPGRIGFINSVTEPFCSRCNRLRLTAEGMVRNCLFSSEEWDARSILRNHGLQPHEVEQHLVDLVRASVWAKKAGHGINTVEFIKPERAMFQIGG